MMNFRSSNKYEYMNTLKRLCLAEVSAEGHTPAEVASVFKHFQRDGSTPLCKKTRAGNGFPRQ